MIGITGWGCYVPRYRLRGEVLSSQWGGSKKGSRSAANYDEDPITMAAEALLDCLENGRNKVDRLYLASTTLPYMEHQNAAVVAAAADLGTDVMAADLTGSTRAGTQALRAAYEAVKSGEAKKAAAVASDARPAKPGDPLERVLGDGAAALVIGTEDPVAVIEGFYSTNRAFLDYWRREGGTGVESGDAKFITDKGILAHLPEALSGLLDKADLAREEITRVVFYSPDPRTRRSIASRLGVNKEALLAEEPESEIGNVGTAQVFISLLAALEKSRPGDAIAVLGHGSGADAVLLRVTEHIGRFKTDLGAQLAAGRELSSYSMFLRFRGILPGEEINVWTSAPVLWREEKQNIRAVGGKCDSCGAVQYPPRRHCWNCGGESMSDYKLARGGKVYAFTLDHLPPSPNPPTPMVSVDLEGGGRLYAQMTDVAPAMVKIGMEVERVFRKIHEGGGFNNYFWKFRPAFKKDVE